MTIIIPDIRHTIYLHILKYLIDWVTSVLKLPSRIDKSNQPWAMMPPYPGLAQFIKPSSQAAQWSGEVMKALGCMMVPVFTATCLNPSPSQSIPFTAVLWCIKRCVCVHLVAQYQYHTVATIEYMENYLEGYYHKEVIFSPFRASEYTKNILEVLKKQLSLDKQEIEESDPTWNNLAAAAKCCCIDED